jgi:uncharacterized repeat protein (TIGR03803 family)
MNRSIIFRTTLSSCVAAAMLAGCGGSQPPIAAPGAMPQAPPIARARAIVRNIRTASSSYRLLYSFAGGTGDGSYPYAGLIIAKGTLYGTTFAGAGSGCYSEYPGCGSVYSISPSGKETVIHSFGRSEDGALPVADLVNIKGTLYGTTSSGGANCDSRGNDDGCGTVFSITTSGAETVLYSFRGGSEDGKWPWAGLTNVKGTLLRHDGIWRRAWRRNGLRDQAVRHGNRALQLQRWVGRRRRAASGPHQRQRHAL